MLGSPADVLIARLSARTALSREEQEALAGLAPEVRDLVANQDFINVGDMVEHVDIVLAGLTARFDLASDGGRQITAIQLPGDLVNARAVVQPISRSAHTALVASKIGTVPMTMLRRVAAQYPRLIDAFWREAAADAENAIQWLVNIGRRDAKARVAHLVCELALRSGEQPLGTAFAFNMPLTQAQLADITGLTGVHINRVLRVLREEKLLILTAKTAHVLDWQRLAEVGQFHRGYLDLAARSDDRRSSHPSAGRPRPRSSPGQPAHPPRVASR